jgi:hypothetical protein
MHSVPFPTGHAEAVYGSEVLLHTEVLLRTLCLVKQFHKFLRIFPSLLHVILKVTLLPLPGTAAHTLTPLGCRQSHSPAPLWLAVSSQLIFTKLLAQTLLLSLLTFALQKNTQMVLLLLNLPTSTIAGHRIFCLKLIS